MSLTGDAPATFTATLHASGVAANHLHEKQAGLVQELALALMFPAGIGLLGVRRGRKRIMLLIVLGTAASLGVGSCGGGGGTGGKGGNTPTSPSKYSLTVVARDSTFGIEHNVGTVSVTVNH